MRSFAWFIVVGAWWVFLIYWFISAFQVKRTIRRQGFGSRLVVLLLVGGGCQMLFTSMASDLAERRLLAESPFLDLMASVAALAGLVITIWARRTIGENWSASVTLKEGHELIQAGPYRFVRHPIYTGFLLMALGAAIIPFRTRGFAGVALVFAGFWFKLRQEEALMTETFPDEYRLYKSRVKALIPWIL
jgi:protein-S-isoprenylcysteine O-methyltransferase Ste14